MHDLSEKDFADTYAQTVTYGLLTTAISRTEMSEGRHGTALTPDDIAAMVPVTNPFLKEMLQEFLTAGGRSGGIDFDELGINEVVELLRGDETDLPAILRDFGNRSLVKTRSSTSTSTFSPPTTNSKKSSAASSTPRNPSSLTSSVACTNSCKPNSDSKTALPLPLPGAKCWKSTLI